MGGPGRQKRRFFAVELENETASLRFDDFWDAPHFELNLSPKPIRGAPGSPRASLEAIFAGVQLNGDLGELLHTFTRVQNTARRVSFATLFGFAWVSYPPGPYKGPYRAQIKNHTYARQFGAPFSGQLVIYFQNSGNAVNKS